MHKSFEELCALAATGQITGDAMSVLDRHVKECGVCRAFLQDMVSLKAHVAPVVAGSHARTLEPPAGIRERFLEKAAAAGLKLNSGPALAAEEWIPVPAPVARLAFADALKSWLVHMQEWYHLAVRYSVPVTAAILCGVVGYLVVQHQAKGNPAVVAVAQPDIPAPGPAIQPPFAPDHSVEIAALKQNYAEERRKLDALTAALTQAQIEKKDLEQKVAFTSERVSEDAHFEQQFRATAQQLESANELIAKLEAEEDAERNKSANAEAVLIVQQRATEEAN